MSEMTIQMATSKEVALTVLSHLRNGKIDDAIAHFSEEFRFEDHGSRVEFKDKKRLAEFFQKARELYPDAVLETDTIFVSGDHVIMERHDYRLGGLLRRPDLAPHGFGCALRGMGRTLISSVSAAPVK